MLDDRVRAHVQAVPRVCVQYGPGRIQRIWLTRRDSQRLGRPTYLSRQNLQPYIRLRAPLPRHPLHLKHVSCPL